MIPRPFVLATLCSFHAMVGVSAFFISGGPYRQSQLLSSEENRGAMGLPPHAATALASRKKKAASEGSTKKMQVKLLDNVRGTGNVGQVVRVTPAFFNNKLRPTQLAVIISDEEVAKEQSEQAQRDEKTSQKAEELRQTLVESKLVIRKKANKADGHLFGGVGMKTIMTEIKKTLQDDNGFLSKKSVKIVSIVDDDGKNVKGDIKQIGKFTATIALTKDVVAKVPLAVEAEK